MKYLATKSTNELRHILVGQARTNLSEILCIAQEAIETEIGYRDQGIDLHSGAFKIVKAFTPDEKGKLMQQIDELKKTELDQSEEIDHLKAQLSGTLAHKC